MSRDREISPIISEPSVKDRKSFPLTVGLPCRTSTKILHGFTLIEILIVVAIIALLVAIMVPALDQAKDRARAVVCLSNQHQIYIGHAVYSNNYDGYVCPSYDYASGGTWARKLRDFITDVKADPEVGTFGSSAAPPARKTVFHCPSEPPHGGSVLRGGYDHIIYGNIREDYAPNILRCGRAHCEVAFGSGYGLGGATKFDTLQVKSYVGLEQTYVGQASKTFLLGDANYMDLEPAHSALENEYGMMFRHNRKRAINLTFFDGHGQTMAYPVGMNEYPEEPLANGMPLAEPW